MNADSTKSRKGLAMELVEQGRIRECFTWESSGDQTDVRHYDITLLRVRIMTGAVRPRKVRVEGQAFETLVEVASGPDREADMQRVAELTPLQAMEPILAAEQDDGSVILIDGTHRVLRAKQDGQGYVLAHIVPESNCPKIPLDELEQHVKVW